MPARRERAGDAASWHGIAFDVRSDMKRRLKRWLPPAERVRASRWVALFGPFLHHPRLWHLSRRGSALGAAIGVFFGLLIPFGQIPLAAALAVGLRAHVPIAVASTFISNPLTFPAIYFVAYHLGLLFVGEASAPAPDFDSLGAWPDPLQALTPARDLSELGFFERSWLQLKAMGRPMLLGVCLLTLAGSSAAYAGMNLLWRVHARVAWRKRVRERQQRAAMRGD